MPEPTTTATPPATTPPTTATPPPTPPSTTAPPAAPPSDAPWYTQETFGLKAETDADLLKHLEGKKFPDLKTALTAGMHADNVARSRNVLDKPDPKNLKDWKGWQELGWTPEIDKYALKRPEIPQGVEYDAGMEDHLRKIAHEARVPLSAAQALLDGMVGYQKQLADQVAAKGASETAALQQALDAKWGADKDKNLAIAKAAMKASGLNADDAATLEKIMGAPALVAWFHRVGSELGEDRMAGGGGGGGGGPSTPEAAAAERRRLEGDAAWMKIFNDPRHPQHGDYVKQRDALLAVEAKRRTA